MSRSSNQLLLDLVSDNKAGKARGIASICSANKMVLEASIKFAAQNDSPVLIESTSNQVNQFGGYTGMTPAQFSELTSRLMHRYDLSPQKMILGGDHLGPYPWRNEPARMAMAKACQMVADCVSAGYSKIHLDASMRCADDSMDYAANKRIFANRAAQLCRYAEDVAAQSESDQNLPLYVIGTEVPVPGGALEEEEELVITSVESLEETIFLTHKAFVDQGLEAAWDRVIAVVVQPGVEYSDHFVHVYQREKAKHLVNFIEHNPRQVFEAHSTDYQTKTALRELVEDHFAILKVGPELTFSYRQGLFALEMIEREIFSSSRKRSISNLTQIVDNAMVEDPRYWQDYYSGKESELAFARKFSFSDRIRYYWPQPVVADAINKLFENLSAIEIPLPIVHQYLPDQYKKIREGDLENNPYSWIVDVVDTVLDKYFLAISRNFGEDE
jgi:D-tagatose-1,6-bisphosphate aldolase subunit GatZ/KbaZ